MSFDFSTSTRSDDQHSGSPVGQQSEGTTDSGVRCTLGAKHLIGFSRAAIRDRRVRVEKRLSAMNVQ